jgi:hypothetical protein
MAVMTPNEWCIDGMRQHAIDEAHEAALEKARRERRHALIFPREHGTWGLLLVPMVTGAGVAFRESSNVFPFLLLLTSALALFWLRTPLESLLSTSAMHAHTQDERRAVALFIAGLGTIAAFSLGTLLWGGRNPALWLIGSAAAAAFVGQAPIKKLGRHWRMLSEIVGTIGLTSSAGAAYYVITGKFGTTAWLLWLTNLVFAGNQIHYVQLRIHTARVEDRGEKLSRGWTFAVGEAVMAAALSVACLRGLLPWIAMAAFVPILFRGGFYFFQKPAPLVVRRLGWNELAQGLVFCVLFIAAFDLGK